MSKKNCGTSIQLNITQPKKECTDPCKKMDESWKHYTKWKKPNIKGQVLYDSIYIKCQD